MKVLKRIQLRKRMQHAISIGGYITIHRKGDNSVWREYSTMRISVGMRRMHFSWRKSIVSPMMVAESDAIMALAFPAVQHLLETFRKRRTWKYKGRRYEKSMLYLQEAWKHVLTRLKLNYRAERYTIITAKKLLASGVFKEMREGI